MAIRYVTFGGTGSGASQSSPAGLLSADGTSSRLDEHLTAAMVPDGTGVYAVRIVPPAASHRWTSTVRLTASVGPADGAIPDSHEEGHVLITGWVDGAEGWVQIVGDRTPEEVPQPGQDDQWIPPRADGRGQSGQSGKVVFDLLTGARNLRFGNLWAWRVQTLVRINGRVMHCDAPARGTGTDRRPAILATECRGPVVGTVEPGLANDDLPTVSLTGAPGKRCRWAVRAAETPKYAVQAMAWRHFSIDASLANSRPTWDGNPVAVALSGNTPAAASCDGDITAVGAGLLRWVWLATPARWSIAPHPTDPADGGTIALSGLGSASVKTLPWNATRAQIRDAVADLLGGDPAAVWVSGAADLASGPIVVAIGSHRCATDPGALNLDATALTRAGDPATGATVLTRAQWLVTATGNPTGAVALSVAGTPTVPVPVGSTPDVWQAALEVIPGLAGRVRCYGAAPAAGGLIVAITDPPPSSLALTTSTVTGGELDVARTANPWAPLSTGYAQGDVVTTEEYDGQRAHRDVVSRIPGPITIRARGVDIGDATCDLKSANTLVVRPYGLRVKRVIRAHKTSAGGAPIVTHAPHGEDPWMPYYPDGLPLAGQTTLGTATLVNCDGAIVVLDPYLQQAADSASAADTVVFDSAGTSGVCTVIVSDPGAASITRAPGSRLTGIAGGKHVLPTDLPDVIAT